MTRFDSARLAALMQDLLAHITGRPADLLPFEAVREGLHLRHIVDRGIQEIPLAAIVGTLGREHAFNRAFLPRDGALKERWQDVQGLAEGAEGFAPIELYRVGDAYFVVDGHHRVSVAKTLGVSTIEARVKEFLSPVPLDPTESIDEVLSRRGLAELLEVTGLHPADPSELVVTIPSGYEKLLDHVSVHRYYRGLELGREVSWSEAAASWYESVFSPMVETIRSSGVLAAFPGHTEADLYLFTMDHLHNLRDRYGSQSIGRALAVRHFRFFYRAEEGLRDRLRTWRRGLLGRLRGTSGQER